MSVALRCNEIDLDHLKPGQRLCPILRASCIWSGGGSVGVSLKAVKILIAHEAETISNSEEDEIFAFHCKWSDLSESLS